MELCEWMNFRNHYHSKFMVSGRSLSQAFMLWDLLEQEFILGAFMLWDLLEQEFIPGLHALRPSRTEVYPRHSGSETGSSRSISQVFRLWYLLNTCRQMHIIKHVYNATDFFCQEICTSTNWRHKPRECTSLELTWQTKLQLHARPPIKTSLLETRLSISKLHLILLMEHAVGNSSHNSHS